MFDHKCPFLSVDVIVYVPESESIVIIQRKYEPIGYALPGGHVDYGEKVEHAAIREIKEETNLDIVLIDTIGIYSDPKRDPRKHMTSVVYLGLAKDISKLKAADDAKEVKLISLQYAKHYLTLCFDHSDIINDFLSKYEKLNGII